MVYKPEWFYFGCYRGPGHNVYRAGMEAVYHSPIEKFDGLLAPLDAGEFVAAGVIRLPNLGLSALSFWDKSIDKRPGSNSTIFAPSNTCDARTILLGAQRYFPEVFHQWPGITIRGVTEAPLKVT